MRPKFLKRNSGWLPAVVVLAVVLGAGSRLIVLSMQQHAANAREAAAVQAARAAHSIESQLQSLAALASAQAERAVGADPDAVSTAPATIAPVSNGFWIAADGHPLIAKGASATLLNGITGEWSALHARRGGALPSILGPTRQGSQWLIVALAPILPANSGAKTEPAGWAAVYADLDQLLHAIHLGRIIDAGYDFALAQVEPNNEQPRTFFNSNTAPLNGAVVLAAQLPPGFSPADAGSYLQIAIRPRAGWYPAREIAAQIGVLAVLAWLLAFGAHDLTHSLQRMRIGVSLYRRRLRAMSERLTTETEKRQELQKSIDHARYHDGFTGMPNRRYFVDQLDRALREVRTRQRQRIAVILVDIARFRVINDTLGHTVGDDLMVQAARRFEKATAAFECVLARWGGDQFAVLILDVAAPEAAVAFAVLLQEALRAPFELRRHRLRVTASMGVTSADSGVQRAEEVLREADIALSVAKKHATRKAILYAPAMGGQAASLVSLEADLHVALAKNQFRLLFQPIVDLQTRRAVGAEALLRWRHPAEGLLAPDKFLAIAEEAGLMVPVTRRIILRVCRLAAEWRRSLPQGQEFYLSVNLSASVLRDPSLSDYVARVLQETGVPPAALKLEVTESALISNVGAARETIERLHKLGVQLMLDDFGTGFSSLNYLQLFPLDFVKIDRPFISRAVSDRANSGMLTALLQLARSLGLTAVAEIVETETAAVALREMGCQFGQGNFFSEPVQAEVALQYLRGEPFPMRSQQDIQGAQAPSTAAVPDHNRAVPAAPQLEPAAAEPIDHSPTVVVSVIDSSPTTRVSVIDDSPTTVITVIDDSPTMILAGRPGDNEDENEESSDETPDPRQRLGSH